MPSQQRPALPSGCIAVTAFTGTKPANDSDDVLLDELQRSWCPRRPFARPLARHVPFLDACVTWVRDRAGVAHDAPTGTLATAVAIFGKRNVQLVSDIGADLPGGFSGALSRFTPARGRTKAKIRVRRMCDDYMDFAAGHALATWALGELDFPTAESQRARDDGADYIALQLSRMAAKRWCVDVAAFRVPTLDEWRECLAPDGVGIAEGRASLARAVAAGA